MPYIISLAAGILLSQAFSRADLHWFAWFSVAPLMYYTYRLGWRQSLLAGLAFGLAFNAGLLYWIGLFGALPLILLCTIESLFVLAFVSLGKLIGSRLGSWARFILLPAIWVSLEWLNSIGPSAFPWGSLGYSQYKLLPLIQVSSLTGIWGVSCILALSNSMLANLADARRRGSTLRPAGLQAALVTALVAGAWLYGSTSIAGFHPSGTPIRAAVIQGNIRPNVPQDAEYREQVWRVYGSLTGEAARLGAEFTVWPEGVVPGCVGVDPVIQSRLADLSKATGVSLLVGGRDEDGTGCRYNSAFLITPRSGIAGRYAKVHLVPFGEVVLLRDYLPLLAQYRVTDYDLSPGPGFTVMDAGRFRVGTAVCFESIFPDISRAFASSGAGLLTTITNDSWFGETSAAEQHMAKSVFRAVETDRYVLRAAVTGISCIIDPRGRILAQKGLFERGVLVEDVSAMNGNSFYTRHEDWLIYLCLGVILAMVIYSLTTRGRHARGGGRPSSSAS
jgi:apolipoprotein N-acyltransferase